MHFQEFIPLAAKTTMRMGGNARYFAELTAREDVEGAWKFAREKHLPFIVLGGGANSVFADGTIEAVVVHVAADAVEVRGTTVHVEAGKILASLVAELAKRDLDLSPLTGIPGTIGGAIFGNAGQGPKGVWMNHFVEEVTAFVDGTWRTFTREECAFRYRESIFKELPAPLIWEVTLSFPTRPAQEILHDIEALLKRRAEAQPFARTAGSCFKALADGTPAWKLIEAAGLRGLKIGDLQISEKHANFLINTNTASFEDLLSAVKKIRASVPAPLQLEMRLFERNGHVLT